jgi:hypothetical protein
MVRSTPSTRPARRSLSLSEVLIMILLALCLAALYTGWTLCRAAARSERSFSDHNAELLAARALGEQQTNATQQDAAQVQFDREARIHRAIG